MAYIDTLPNELLTFVFDNLSFKDREVVQQVSKRWWSVVQSIWNSEKVLANNLSQLGKGYSHCLTSCNYSLETVKKCPNIEVLFWTQQETMMSQNIFKIFSHCKQLKHLEIIWPFPYYIQYLSDLALLPSLQTLSIEGLALDDEWCRVLQSLPNLKAFSKTDLTLRELHLLLQTKNLTALSTNKIAGSLDHVLGLFSTKVHSLTRLQIDTMCCCNTNIDEVAAEKLFKQLPHLTHLKVETRYRALSVLKSVPNLKGITWENVPNIYFPRDYKYRKVASFFDDNDYGYESDNFFHDHDDDYVEDLVLAYQIEEFLAPEENLSYNFYKFLGDHKQLTYINLNNIKNLTFPTDCFRDIGIQCPQLETFIIHQSFTNTWNRTPNNDVFLHLSKAENLKTLILLNFRVSIEGIAEHLSNFKSLETLVINSYPMTDLSLFNCFVDYALTNPRRKIMVDIGHRKNMGCIPPLPGNLEITHQLDYALFAAKTLM